MSSPSFVRAKSSGAELTRFPSLAGSKLWVYTFRTTCRNRRYSSSLVPVSVAIPAGRIPGTSFLICSNQSRCQKNTESRQLKILAVTPLCSFYRTNGFLDQKAVGLDCCTILLSIEVESSDLSARAVFLPQWNLYHQAESLHDALIIEPTAFLTVAQSY